MNPQQQSSTTTRSESDGLPWPRLGVAALSVSLGTIVTTVDGTIVNVALPTLARDLGVAPSSAVLVVTIYQLVLMMTLLPFSALGDRIGLRKTYQVGQAVFVVATVLCFFAHSLPFLVLVRGVQALGAAAVLSVSAALIRQIYPLSRLGRGLSFNTVIAASAASLAPTVGGAVLSVASWPWLFAIIVPFGVFSLVIGQRALPDNVRRDEPYDVLDAVMCAGTIALCVIGLESGVHGDSPVVSAAMLALGIGLGWFFVRRALGQERPLFPVDLLRQRIIALPCAGAFCAYLCTMVMMVSLPIRLQQQFGFSPIAAGAAMAPMAMASTVVAPVAGLLSDRYAAGLLGAIGMAIGVPGLLLLAFLPADPGHAAVFWRVGLCGVGFGMYQSPVARHIIGSAPRDRTAAAGALQTTVRGAGQTLGATMVAALLAVDLGEGPAPLLIASLLALAAGALGIGAWRLAPVVRTG